MRLLKNINEIIVHCTASRPSQDWRAKDIRRLHLSWKWSDIGYHFVICRDGSVELGRSVKYQGAHCSGHNEDTLGVVLVGGVTEHDTSVPENNFTPEQFNALERVLKELKEAYNINQISGHRDYAAKACPSFDIHAFVAERGI